MTATSEDAKYGESLGEYDAIVVGGGIAGAAAAYSLATAGRRTVLIEPTGVLGREIVRARFIYGSLDQAAAAESSSSMSAFYRQLKQCGGWFPEGVMDPNVAGLAFDEMLSSCEADVMFHVWPARLLHEGNKVQGIVAATKGGYRTISGKLVIDASEQGKLSRPWSQAQSNAGGISILNLMVNEAAGSGGHSGSLGSLANCAPKYETMIDCPGIGTIEAIVKPTHWSGEYRISLVSRQRLDRAGWMAHLGELLLRLQQEMGARRGFTLSYIGTDVWSTPEAQLYAPSSDNGLIGCLNGDAESRPRRNPEAMDGLIMAGPWAGDLRFDPLQEERFIVDAFSLGDVAAACGLGLRD